MITVAAPETDATAARRAGNRGRAARVDALCTLAAAPVAVPTMRHFAVDAARRWAVPEDSIDALALVVSELVGNAVVHSGGPEVTMLIRYQGAQLTVEVKDTGRWHPSDTERPASSPTEATSGRGLDLIRQLTSWWLAFLSPAGTRIVACLPAAPAAG